jgi:hypothetical protein
LFNEIHSPVLVKEAIRGTRNSMIIVKMRTITLGNVTFNDVPAFVSNNPIIRCFDVDGSIGSNMLRNSIVRFCSKNKTIILTDNETKLQLPEKETSKLFLASTQSSPYFQIKFKNGKHTGKEQLEFDSGDNCLYTFSLSHTRLFKKDDVFNVVAKTTGSNIARLSGIEDDTIKYRLTLPEIDLGEAVLQNPVFETTHDVDSKMGTKLLDYGIVTVDYLHKKFYFEPFRDFTNVQEKQYPVSPTLKNNKLLVGIVWDEDLKDTIHVGDEIVSINGRQLDDNNYCDAMTALPLKGKDSIILKIKNSSGDVSDFVLIKK